MIEVDITLPVPPAKVWEYLTGSRHQEAWWGDNVRLDAVRGGKFSEDWTDKDGRSRHSEGIVTALEPEKRLQLSWQDDGWAQPTRVEWMLSARDGGSRLYLQHSGWETFEDEDARAQSVEEYREGWWAQMEKFKEYVIAHSI